jgi:predicted Zn-dependent protease
MNKKLVVQRIKTPKKIERLLKVILSPVFYVWAVMFALVAIIVMVIEEKIEDKQTNKKEFDKNIEEFKESVKNDLARYNTKNIQ